MFFTQDTKVQLDLDYIMGMIRVHTPFGARLKKSLRVFKADEQSALEAHYKMLGHLKEMIEKHPVTFKRVRDVLSHFKNIELSVERVYSGEVLSTTELFEIKNFAIQSKRLFDLTEDLDLKIKIDPMHALLHILDPDDLGINSFFIYDSYSEKLKTIRTQLKDYQQDYFKIRKEKRIKLSNELGIKIRPNDEVSIDKKETALMDLLNQHESFMYISDSLMHKTYKVLHKNNEEMIASLKADETEEEYQVRIHLTKDIEGLLEEIRYNIAAIGQLDLFMGKAYFAKAYQMVEPKFSNGFKLEAGIHLKVSNRLKEDHLDYMPISITLEEGTTVITGANMGGKTICLKLIGQMIMMAQYGLFVPCKSFEFKPVDFIFIAAKDGQSIDEGLSSFGAEITQISEVIQKDHGLILIDELARGTNPKEGYAISKAIINHMKNKSSFTVITTHFDGLADDEEVLHLQVRGLADVDFEDLKIDIDANSLERIHSKMDYTLKVIQTKEEVPKDALKISKLMGMDERILEDAKRILMKEVK